MNNCSEQIGRTNDSMTQSLSLSPPTGSVMQKVVYMEINTINQS